MATGNPARKPVEFGSDYPIIYEVFFTIQTVVGNGISAINSINKCNQNLATPRGNSVFFTSFFFSQKVNQSSRQLQVCSICDFGSSFRDEFPESPHISMVVSAGGSRNDPAGFEDFGGGCGVGGVGG